MELYIAEDAFNIQKRFSKKIGRRFLHEPDNFDVLKAVDVIKAGHIDVVNEMQGGYLVHFVFRNGPSITPLQFSKLNGYVLFYSYYNQIESDE